MEDACVEVATCPHTVHVRDSEVIDGPHVRRRPGRLDRVPGPRHRQRGRTPRVR
ncbi:DUF397 domain-containing protein [Streptomyces sp. NPDC055886]